MRYRSDGIEYHNTVQSPTIDVREDIKLSKVSFTVGLDTCVDGVPCQNEVIAECLLALVGALGELEEAQVLRTPVARRQG